MIGRTLALGQLAFFEPPPGALAPNGPAAKKVYR